MIARAANASERDARISESARGLPGALFPVEVAGEWRKGIEKSHSGRAELPARRPLGRLGAVIAHAGETLQGVAHGQASGPVAQKLESARLSALHHVVVQIRKPAILRERGGPAEDQRRSNRGHGPLPRLAAHRARNAGKESRAGGSSG